MRIAARKLIISTALGFGTLGSLAMSLMMATPAHAQITVFDPGNYSQNLLTAARTLSQINNQIQSLQNEAAMLINQAKNLSRIDFPQLQAIMAKLQQIDRLMGQAQGIGFRVDGIEQQYRRLFPEQFDAALKRDGQVMAARARLDAAMGAFRQTMSVQSEVVENVQEDAQTLSALVARSQGAEGALQVGQATNQLLALAAKQQFQIQTLMAAQYRAQSMEQARRTQAEIDGRARTRRFLGAGSAYTQR
ncbi:P-type conjugative transfer protein TrbJ [Sphingomonas soli]|uniref:P-type conjugative transfer protein TrbJ n=1 Tax=Sphingomonas soli TaxID=266127 RepID=UPI00082F8990|nr:P-type conjugative transfer protein TrbJ [Sphingomonas soli]